MQLRTHTHSDGLVLSSNHTHTYRRADCFFFCYVYKNGRQCTKYRHILPKSRARKLWLYTTFCCCISVCRSRIFLFCFVCVSVITLLILRSTLLLFCFSYTLERLNCFLWFVCFSLFLFRTIWLLLE